MAASPPTPPPPPPIVAGHRGCCGGSRRGCSTGAYGAGGGGIGGDGAGGGCGCWHSGAVRVCNVQCLGLIAFSERWWCRLNECPLLAIADNWTHASIQHKTTQDELQRAALRVRGGVLGRSVKKRSAFNPPDDDAHGRTNNTVHVTQSANQINQPHHSIDRSLSTASILDDGLPPHHRQRHHHAAAPVFPSVSYAFHHSPPGAGETQAAQAAASESAAQCADAPYVLLA
jgi:hypothetical protein